MIIINHFETFLTWCCISLTIQISLSSAFSTGKMGKISCFWCRLFPAFSSNEIEFPCISSLKKRFIIFNLKSNNKKIKMLQVQFEKKSSFNCVRFVKYLRRQLQQVLPQWTLVIFSINSILKQVELSLYKLKLEKVLLICYWSRRCCCCCCSSSSW